MDGPPPHVDTAILRGGPCDNLLVEIEEGETEMTPKVLAGWGKGPAPEIPKYRFSGEIDGEGNAVFEVAADV